MKLKIKPIKQLNGYYCGPACIEMVMRFFGKTNRRYSQKAIGQRWRTDDTGMTITEMKNCLTSFKIKPVRVTAKKQLTANRVIYYIKKYQLPIIFDTEYHFMLVIGFDNFNIFVIDPYKGKVIKYGKRNRLWTKDLEGYVICLPKEHKSEKKRRK